MTTADYFAATPVCCGPSIADDEAQCLVDEVCDAFDKFLDAIGCETTRRSEWSYCSPHYGLEAEVKGDLLYYEPETVDEWPSGLYCDQDFMELWNARVPRLKAMHDWLERNEYHLQHADYGYNGYVKRKHRRFAKRFDVVYCAFETAVDDALKELCGECEELLDAECDYAYSEDAAKEWVEAQI